jgi:hypothetical protein
VPLTYQHCIPRHSQPIHVHVNLSPPYQPVRSLVILSPSVILSEAKDLSRQAEMLRSAQHDNTLLLAAKHPLLYNENIKLATHTTMVEKPE